MEIRHLPTVVYEKDGPIAWITLDYPEKANIQSSDLVFDVDTCLDDADRDYDIKVVVLKANGPGFSAGHVVVGTPGTEMREIDESTARLGSPWKGQWDIYGTPVMKLWDFPKVTIAQVHGYCLGGGTVWGLLTDMTVASEDAYFQFPVLQGMAMPTMETGIEPWLFMNFKRASEYMYTSQELSAQEAKDMGLVNRVVPIERLDDEVAELAFLVAQAPLTTLMAAKANIRRAWDMMGLRTHLQASNDLLTVATAATDVQEYIRAVYAQGLRPRDAARINAEKAKVLAGESKARRRAG
ncbi:MAG TPA: enoyl-CoA hydratase-related protein [Acidimicrobiales bacterium]